MAALLKRSPERISIANKFVKILVFFGVFAFVTDYINHNWVMVFTSFSATVLSLAVLYLGRRPQYSSLPLIFSSGMVIAIYLVGVITQLPVYPAKLAWISIFPFIYFYLMGLRYGLLISVLSILLMPIAYLSVKNMGGLVITTIYDLLEGFGGFGLATLIAYKYEQIRTSQETLLKHTAENDLLTGLLNRRGFSNLAEVAFLQATRFGQPFAVIFMDLDNFKRLNDTLGHEAGDMLLKEVAEVLRSVTRTIDIVARWGGEEFIVLLMQSDATGARQAGEKIRSNIASNNFISGKFTVSVGVAINEMSETIDETICRADQAMYQAKKLGKNRVEFIGKVIAA